MPVYDIEVDPNDPATVYVAFAATSGEGRLYRLRRSTPLPATMTASPMTASPMTEGLPDDLVVRTVAVDPFRPLTVYAGTNRGVYQGRSNDEGLAWTWTPYNMGLPLAVDIADLEVHPTSRVMRAATYGRGAYEVMTGQQ
jgi:hypothetical protein